MKATSKHAWLIFLSFLLSACQGGGGGGGNASDKSSSAAASNNRPIANAGEDMLVLEKQLVTLDGSASYDLDNDPLFYEWRQTSGPAVSLSSESDDTPSFIAPEGERILSYQLVINDGKDISIADTVTITVVTEIPPDPDTEPNTGTNQAPIARAGGNRSSVRGQVITLDGTQSSDPDNDPLTYLWTQTGGENVALNFNTIASPSFTAPDTIGPLTFSLIVNDGQLNSLPSLTIISVNETATNHAPVAHAGTDQTANGNDTITLDGSQSHDPDGDALNYLWQQSGGDIVHISNEQTVFPQFTAPETGGTLSFTLTVNDGQLDSVSDEVTITLAPVNDALIVDAGEDQSVRSNTLVTLNGSNSRAPNGESLTYTWKQSGGPGVILDSTSAVMPVFTSPEVDANLIFSLVVNNGETNSSTDTVVISVSHNNSQPVSNAGENQTVNANSSVTLNGSQSSDPENDTLSYLWEQTSGPTIELTDLTAANPTFTAPSEGANLNFKLVVNDGLLSSIADFVTITVTEINHPPVANAGVDRYVGSLSVVALKGINSYDQDDDQLTYLWSQLSGPIADLSDTTIANPVFPANIDGRLVFSLIVNDGEFSSQADLVTVNVGPIPVTNTKVNGTGITWGASYPTGNNADCTGEAIEQQDCSTGRELTHNDDTDGRVGFSYTKIDLDGVETDSSADEWDCTQDNVTGLMWEVKKGGNGTTGDEGLTDADDRFSWYNSDASSNGGAEGFPDNAGDMCFGYNEADSATFCNTQAFAARVNNHALCGYADWRVPTRKELLTLVDYGQNIPMIDNNYFPSSGEFVWSATPLALESNSAWGVYFNYGNSFSIDRQNARQVRVVRGGY